MRFIILLVGLGALLGNGAFGVSEIPADSLNEDFTIAWRFVGCRPSGSECRYSCNTGWIRVEMNPDYCNPEIFEERFTCFCGTATETD